MTERYPEGTKIQFLDGLGVGETFTVIEGPKLMYTVTRDEDGSEQMLSADMVQRVPTIIEAMAQAMWYAHKQGGPGHWVTLDLDLRERYRGRARSAYRGLQESGLTSVDGRLHDWSPDHLRGLCRVCKLEFKSWDGSSCPGPLGTIHDFDEKTERCRRCGKDPVEATGICFGRRLRAEDGS